MVNSGSSTFLVVQVLIGGDITETEVHPAKFKLHTSFLNFFFFLILETSMSSHFPSTLTSLSLLVYPCSRLNYFKSLEFGSHCFSSSEKLKYIISTKSFILGHIPSWRDMMVAKPGSFARPNKCCPNNHVGTSSPFHTHLGPLPVTAVLRLFIGEGWGEGLNELLNG